jgi:hypothetical protein
MIFGAPPRTASPEPMDDDRTLHYRSPSPDFKRLKRNHSVAVLPLHKHDVSNGYPNHIRHFREESMVNSGRVWLSASLMCFVDLGCKNNTSGIGCFEKGASWMAKE